MMPTQHDKPPGNCERETILNHAATLPTAAYHQRGQAQQSLAGEGMCCLIVYLHQTSETTCLRKMGPVFRPESRKLAPRLHSVQRECQRPAYRPSKTRPEPRRDTLQRRQVHLPKPAAVPRGNGWEMRCSSAPDLESVK